MSHYSIDVPISGMTCAACASRIERVLSRIPGVEAEVSFANETARLQFDDQQHTLASLYEKITHTGYGIRPNVQVWSVPGLASAGQTGPLQQQLQRLPLQHWQLNLADETVQLSFLPGLLQEATLVAALGKAGFVASLVEGQTEAPAPGFWQQHGRLLLAILLTLPFLPGMVSMLLGSMYGMLPPVWQWLLATPLQCWLGAPFYRSAWRAVRAGAANMDVLVALGTSAAYGYSLWLWLGEGSPHLYFEASSAILTLVMLGKALESRARRQTQAALMALAQLRPQQALRWSDEAQDWLSVPTRQLQAGDRFLLRVGDAVPVDGQVREGEGILDEAMLTGESLPVGKQVGATVFAGTVLQAGRLVCEASAVGEATQLGQIIRLVQEAQSSRAPIQRFADQVAAWFVPAVLGLAILTLLGWWGYGGSLSQAIPPAIAVLVIACPCALGLATPTVIMVGVGQGARHGILFRHAAGLERLARTRQLALDKTGTLTEGHPVLHGRVSWQPGLSAETILHWSACLEREANHPLAAAICRAAGAVESLPLRAFQQVVGEGVRAELEVEGQWRALQLLAAAHVTLSAAAAQQVAGWQEEGATVVVLAEGKTALGALALADPLRPGGREALQWLRAEGITPHMLTGDQPRTAEAVARQLGLEAVHAGLSPQGKAERIQQLKALGPVAMVGDGINDAPALTVADVGLAVASGSDVARAQADVTLLHGRLTDVVAAIDLSRATGRKIRQNLFFALCYNALGIPLAMLGQLNPVIAGAAMALSSVSVVSNALLLKRWRPPL
ncbi:heavy metal translocating P-type ATPase [Leeia sp.]|uniref:heavy metal translocating P-type ATPase n=1 Tax=Leeia sp. TaxID=2884678 RepID=UPI0035AEF842